jgi:neurexin
MVEFVIVIDVEYEALANSAHRKTRLVEALARLFEDPDPRNVVIRSFEAGPPTVVRWHNASLVKCSDEEITQLRRYLIDDDSKLTSRCKDTLSSADFIPQSASLVPLGSCSSAFTPTHGPETDVSVDGVEEKGAAAPADASWSDDYLLTFIVPGIIITLMLLLAAVIACVLYRRRRTGKLGLEERRGFVSKGIPIIFAEELEERPSGRHPAKAPVILKEEKPSQPPDYHKIRSSTSPYPAHKASTTSSEQRDLLRTPSEDVDDEQASLYQPPPPVSANRESSRYSRPKATPAYRKPPPYVPP